MAGIRDKFSILQHLEHLDLGQSMVREPPIPHLTPARNRTGRDTSAVRRLPSCSLGASIQTLKEQDAGGFAVGYDGTDEFEPFTK